MKADRMSSSAKGRQSLSSSGAFVRAAVHGPGPGAPEAPADRALTRAGTMLR